MEKNIKVDVMEIYCENTNISQLCFPTRQIPQKTDCQGGQGSPRAVVPSEEEEEEIIL
jgi:hypothetical protein